MMNQIYREYEQMMNPSKSPMPLKIGDVIQYDCDPMTFPELSGRVAFIRKFDGHTYWLEFIGPTPRKYIDEHATEPPYWTTGNANNMKLLKRPEPKGIEQLAKDLQPSKSDDLTRVNQLLNELYHDRSRLEKRLKRAASIMDGVYKQLQEDAPGASKDWLKRYGALIGQMAEFSIGVTGEWK